MPSEKDKHLLKSSDYDIGGNSIRAFYDRRGRLVCVLDLTITKFKPNVLLVIDGVDDRKWDDVLANDYNMDLELVRPKKDNKYQKMDIEYDGLDVYSNLIDAYKDGTGVKGALKELKDFQVMAAHKSASERLDASMTVAENARDTIERTNDAISDLRAKIKTVRAKLAELRHNVGRVPTKQSAAKILKAEAQVDVLNDKLKRAKKRLENANRRLLTAEDDMAAARAVLALSGDESGNRKKQSGATRSVAPKRVAKPVFDADDDIDEDEEYNQDIDDDSEYDEDDDINNDVKPLFDQDPEIIDEKIAFKPISFDETVDKQDEDVVVNDAPVKKTAVSFEPPKSVMDVVQVPEQYEKDNDAKLSNVFFEGINDEVKYDANVIDETPDSEAWQMVQDSVNQKEESRAGETDGQKAEEFSVESPAPDLHVDDNVMHEDIHEDIDIVQQEYEQPVPAPVVDTPAPVVAPVSEMARPVSPAGVPHIVPSAQYAPVEHHRPNLLYYVLLLVLIGLSVFTLWLYQRSNVNNDVMPTVVAEAPVATTSDVDVSVKEKTVVPEDENPFIDDMTPEVKEDTAQGGVVPVVETSLNKISQMVEQNKDTDSVADIQQYEPAPDVEESPALYDEPDDSDVYDDKQVADKPEYNVTTNNVFVDEKSGVQGGELCEGDVAPDEHGCCPGESYEEVGGKNVCCPDGGGECFEPMF